LFSMSKIIYSLYDTLNQAFDYNEFAAKASINNLEADDLIAYKSEEEVNVHKGAIAFADAIIKVGEVNDVIEKALSESDKPILDAPEATGFGKAYFEFYNSLEAEVVS
jgi:starch synthase